jgi:NAD(P)-dependent dehydrogenase (short-subunit alcohol dehydrogenase family)
MATPYEIAKGIVFLASDDVTFMTGSALVVDGGIIVQITADVTKDRVG